MRITINNIPVNVQADSLSIDDSIGERSTASFNVIDKQGLNHYEQGQPVDIYDNADTLIYSGVIDKPTEKKLGRTGLLHSVSCKDNHYLADKRIMAKAYENQTAGSILSDIIGSYLNDEGVSEGTIQSGPVVNEAVFNYVTVTKALEALAEKAGFIWYIDYEKKLHFCSRSTNYALWDLTSKDVLFNSATVEHGNPKYRNKQYVKGGTDITDPMTQNFKGDGQNKSFTLGFPLAKVPTVKVNGISKTIGIKGLDSNKDWYWSKGDAVLVQSDTGIPLLSTDTLSVTYQGMFDIVVITYDTDQIDERRALEQNSGIVEDVADEMDTTNREAAFQSANAKLKKYAVMGRRLKFQTTRNGLKPGQLLIVTLPEHNLNNTEMLIESVDISYNYPLIYYDVTCAEGPEQNSWAKMFEVMATRGQVFVIRENISEKQILITLQTFNKTWLQADVQNIFLISYPGNTIFPNSTLTPAFNSTDRVKYVELLDTSNNVLARKKITKQTGADTSVISSTAYIAPFEAIGSISKVRYFGGMFATDSNGSGVMIAENTYSKAKTGLEALQLDRTDTKGW